MKNLINRFAAWAGYIKSTPGDWAKGNAAVIKPAQGVVNPEAYTPDDEFEQLSSASVKSPVVAFMEALRDGTKFDDKFVEIREAHLFAGRIDADGKLLKDAATIDKIRESSSDFPAQPYRVMTVSGSDFIAKLTEAENDLTSFPSRAYALREAKNEVARKLREDGFDSPSYSTQYDRGQYSEYTPIMGGPQSKQLYLTAYLQMHSRAFEAWNHNPLAKRVVKLLAQYSMGRGYQAVSKNEKVQEAWDTFEKQYDIKRKMTRFWPTEYLVAGELMVDKVRWQSIDPSTVWDIITDPDNIEDVYYYHQQYPTAYSQFTGKDVPGVPGASKVKPMQFIIRQLPFDQVIHMKGECFSNEKRGRSKIYPILGWLKRLKDLYNSQVIKAWLGASFIWDDTIKGSDADIAAHVSQYSQMPQPGSIFAHNEAIVRQPMQPVMPRSAQDQTAQEIIAFVGTAVGIPKEHLNMMDTGGTRATALVSSEPFTKVIEEVQGDFEDLLHKIAKSAMEQAGIEYDPEELEFVFPSVTKDVTSETVKNIMAGEASGFISKETAATMYAAEMNITTYDYNHEQESIKAEKEAGLADVGAMPGDPMMSDAAQPEVLPSDATPIRGVGKVDVQKNMARL